jgi:hypothetical protein
MSAWCEDEDLPGMAGWMRQQADEERAHALKFYNHLRERNARVEIAAIEEPRQRFGSPLAVFEHGLAHEREGPRRSTSFTKPRAHRRTTRSRSSSTTSSRSRSRRRACLSISSRSFAVSRQTLRGSCFLTKSSPRPALRWDRGLPEALVPTPGPHPGSRSSGRAG